MSSQGGTCTSTAPTNPMFGRSCDSACEGMYWQTCQSSVAHTRLIAEMEGNPFRGHSRTAADSGAQGSQPDAPSDARMAGKHVPERKILPGRLGMRGHCDRGEAVCLRSSSFLDMFGYDMFGCWFTICFRLYVSRYVCVSDG
jgi:hypothetical protein